jgi:2-iminobutanoate/2-iminopropanoate deaminase
MNKLTVATDKAPRAIGPYEQAIKVGEFVYVSGQIPLDPKTGKLVDGGIKEQTCQVMENLKAILEAAGSSLDRVVKATVFLKSIADFTAMNEVYGEYLDRAKPARSTVAVADLPRGALVEIDLVATL